MGALPHLISAKQFDRGYIDRILRVSGEFEDMNYRPRIPEMRIDGFIVKTWFGQPSTRTRVTFEAAAKRMGGAVISTPNSGQDSSESKGERIEDTIEAVQGACADIIVIRHACADVPVRAAAMSKVPIINAGNGSVEHPTQTLVDLRTFKIGIGRIDNLHIVVCGDLQMSRTLRSMVFAAPHLEDVRFTFVSARALRLPDDLRAFLVSNRIPFDEVDALRHALPAADAVYMLRPQREYRPGGMSEISAEEKAKCTMTRELMDELIPGAIVTHPGPRNDEIAVACDTHPAARYGKVGEVGVAVRQAILWDMLRNRERR